MRIARIPQPAPQRGVAQGSSGNPGCGIVMRPGAVYP